LIAASGAVPEKSPQIAFVTFTAAKWGGIVRYPSEIEVDSIVPLGQFLARYIAREMSKLEDTVFFTADGSGTYNSLTGVLGQEITLGNKIVSATGNTSPDKLTLANFRQLRGQVSSAALPGAAYYMNLTMENQLVSFNTSATVTPYIRNGMTSTLDGFPINWVDVMPVFGTSATVSANQAGFGDLSYHYLGVRVGLQIDLSREVYFTTDEWGLRALERFTTGLMADKSNATLALAAS
jgi:HK97 family phage major capsid protein